MVTAVHKWRDKETRIMLIHRSRAICCAIRTCFLGRFCAKEISLVQYGRQFSVKWDLSFKPDCQIKWNFIFYTFAEFPNK